MLRAVKQKPYINVEGNAFAFIDDNGQATVGAGPGGFATARAPAKINLTLEKRSLWRSKRTWLILILVFAVLAGLTGGLVYHFTVGSGSSSYQ